MFFVVGSARSGTTLLRLILNTHGGIAVPPESRFIVELHPEDDHEVEVEPLLAALAAHKRFQAWDLPIDSARAELEGRRAASYAEVMEAAYKAYAGARSKTAWGDKTPRYIEHIPLLAHLWPASRFIHLVRDGRNVALSYAEVPFGPNNVAHAGELWKRRVTAGLTAGRALGAGRYLEVSYEQLVADPRSQVADICDFIGLGFESEMLDYRERSRDEVLPRAAQYNPRLTEGPLAEARSWQEQMPESSVEIFEAVAGDLLSDLGYPRRYPNPSPRARAAAAFGRLRMLIPRRQRSSKS